MIKVHGGGTIPTVMMGRQRRTSPLAKQVVVAPATAVATEYDFFIAFILRGDLREKVARLEAIARRLNAKGFKGVQVLLSTILAVRFRFRQQEEQWLIEKKLRERAGRLRLKYLFSYGCPAGMTLEPNRIQQLLQRTTMTSAATTTP